MTTCNYTYGEGEKKMIPKESFSFPLRHFLWEVNRHPGGNF